MTKFVSERFPFQRDGYELKRLLQLLWREFETKRCFLTDIVLSFSQHNFVLNVSLPVLVNISAISLKFSCMLIHFLIVLNAEKIKNETFLFNHMYKYLSSFIED